MNKTRRNKRRKQRRDERRHVIVLSPYNLTATARERVRRLKQLLTVDDRKLPAVLG